jgi:transglutaminase-like putative cysteine protease
MAHATGTPVRLQRLTALVAICLVAVAVGFAFGRILQGHGATWRMLGVGLASGLIAWATERRGMLVATLASAAGCLLAVTWFASPETTWYGAPTLETLRTIGDLATQVGGQAREYVSPAPMTPALLLAGTVAVWAAVFSCYALAFRAQSPLLGLVPPLALIVFADSVLEELIRPQYGILFLFAAIAVLFADSLRRLQGWGPIWSPTGARDRLLPIAGRNARRVGLTAVSLALLAPVFMPGFGERAVFSLSSINSDHRIRLSPLVSVGAVLNGSASNDVWFVVQATEPSYWRMVTLDTNDGTTWQPTPDGDGIPVVSGVEIGGTGASGTPVQQTVTIQQDAAFSWLIAAATPTKIAIDHNVSWHQASSSLQMGGWPDAGESYTVTSAYSDATVRDLRLSGVAEEPADQTALPGDIPAVIKATAARWTTGIADPFDKALEIQRRLQQFQYDPTVAPKDDPSSLADMLTRTRRGFCQQFASLMAVMLRELGIPARVALGFTTGTKTTVDGQAAYVVRAKNYHSWVEVPFQGYGWMPFDPTPTFPGDPTAPYVGSTTSSTGVCPGARPGCSNKGGGSNGGTDLQTRKFGGTGEEQGPVAGDLRTGGATRLRDRFPVGPIALALLAAGLLVAIAIPLVRAGKRRRKLHAAHDPRELILATYDVFGERAGDLGWPRGPGETPDEFRRRLRAVDGLDEGERASLDRITGAVVRAAYAPTQPDRAASDDATTNAQTVLRGLRHTASWKQRVLGRYRFE